MGKIISDNLAYAKVVREMGFRTNAATTSLATILPEELELTLKAAAEISMGTEISESDISHIHSLCDQVISITAYRTQLAEYLRNRMNAIAPNLTALVGELVGARLISHAGSLMSLAKHPASTVQILGAEKALFRALKTKHDTPKYGLIYHASLIGQAPQKLKGKMARMVATKAALSIRVDALADVDDKSEATAAAIGIENRAKLESRLRALEHQSELGSLPFASSRKQSKFEMTGATKQYNTAADSVGADKMDLDPIPTERAPTEAAVEAVLDVKEERRKAKAEKKQAKEEKRAKKAAKQAEEAKAAAPIAEVDEEEAKKERKRLKKEAKLAAAAAVAAVAEETMAASTSNGAEKKHKKRRVDDGESPEKKKKKSS
ncbi:Nucleolar protein 58 [Ceratobasidium sp. 428]|nr:Nucleolar protein 58 [Ceratobasidium sp. 428]